MTDRDRKDTLSHVRAYLHRDIVILEGDRDALGEGNRAVTNTALLGNDPNGQRTARKNGHTLSLALSKNFLLKRCQDKS